MLLRCHCQQLSFTLHLLVRTLYTLARALVYFLTVLSSPLAISCGAYQSEDNVSVLFHSTTGALLTSATDFPSIFPRLLTLLEENPPLKKSNLLAFAFALLRGSDIYVDRVIHFLLVGCLVRCAQLSAFRRKKPDSLSIFLSLPLHPFIHPSIRPSDRPNEAKANVWEEWMNESAMLLAGPNRRRRRSRRNGPHFYFYRLGIRSAIWRHLGDYISNRPFVIFTPHLIPFFFIRPPPRMRDIHVRTQ